MYSLHDYQFDLPQELIAVEPLEERNRSRMMIVSRDSGTFDDGQFFELPETLQSGDVLVLNNTKVFPARLIGRSATGAAVEIFLIREAGHNRWETLARPARRLPPGKRIVFASGFSATVIERDPDGRLVVEFETDGDLNEAIDEFGRTPLPPYIKRDPDPDAFDRDRERYQTIYASERGAIAAPTAGLHFTPEILDKLKAKGITMVEITLHVGYGTFEPVRVDDLSKHSVAPERYEMNETAASLLNLAKEGGQRIIAVGTTTTRALETNISRFEKFCAEASAADLTILPGREFKAIDGLLTNFHLPKSSLLVLVSSFAGRELIMNAYKHAVEKRYRFYSYGDCMLIL